MAYLCPQNTLLAGVELHKLRLALCVVQADMDADLAAAAEEAPLPLTSIDTLRKRIEQLKQDALAVRSKKRYMQGRLQEASQLARDPLQQAGRGQEGDAPGANKDAPGPSQPVLQQSVQPGSSGGPTVARAADAGAGEGASSAAAVGSGVAGGSSAQEGAGAGSAPPAAGASSALECPVCYGALTEDILVFSSCGERSIINTGIG